MTDIDMSEAGLSQLGSQPLCVAGRADHRSFRLEAQTDFQQRFSGTMRGHRMELIQVGMPSDHVQRAATDGAGCTQQGDLARR